MWVWGGPRHRPNAGEPLSCQLMIAAANASRLTRFMRLSCPITQYLEHQAQQDNHGQA